MAPSKCNFKVFASNKKNDLSIKIKIQYIKAAWIKTLNVLKILSNKKWGL